MSNFTYADAQARYRRSEIYVLPDPAPIVLAEAPAVVVRAPLWAKVLPMAAGVTTGMVMPVLEAIMTVSVSGPTATPEQSVAALQFVILLGLLNLGASIAAVTLARDSFRRGATAPAIVGGTIALVLPTFAVLSFLIGMAIAAFGG